MNTSSSSTMDGLNSISVPETNPFTHFYAQLLHQGNMLQDYIRTGTYQQAILQNPTDFRGKVVLDVGTGTGILAFFAIQAGASKVYAVDASDSCIVAQKLADANKFTSKIVIIKGKIEEIDLPEKVDVIISEPIGFLLVHERMLESYIVARDRFLKPDGKMYPSSGSIILAPISDESLYQEQITKIQFWNNSNFYGIDLSPAVEQAYNEYFAQPVVGYFHSGCIISPHRTVHTIDFLTVTCDEIKAFVIDFVFRIDRTSICHGIGGWFDITFKGSNVDVVLPTGPDSPGTHWYQCRLLLKDPVAVNKGQHLSGKLHFLGNSKFSYDITFDATIPGTEVLSTNSIKLHDQMYHYLQATTSATDMFGNSHGDRHGHP